MPRAGFGQLATDAAEVVQVDECDIVDQRGRISIDEVTLEEEAATTVGIFDRPCDTEPFGEIRPK